MTDTREYRPRAQRGYTYDPCPGCRKENHRKKDSVCSDCETKFLEADEARRKLERPGSLWYRVHLRSVHNNHSYYAANATSDGAHALQAAFTKLIEAVADGTYEEGIWDPDQGHKAKRFPFKSAGALIKRPPALEREQSLSYADHVLLPPTVRDALNGLDRAILLAIASVKEESARNGVSLINKLATGRMTLDKMNAHIARDSADRLKAALADKPVEEDEDDD